MRRNWQKALGSLAVGLLLAAPAAGCAGRPAPRPEAGAPSPQGAINRTLSTQVTQTVASVGGAGAAQAIVKGNVALVAIQLNTAQPGGTSGQPLTGKSHDVDYPGTSPSGGPTYQQGPGSSVGASPARPGGQISPISVPGGTPNWTQAIPNASGMNATTDPAGTAPAPVPGATGSAPMDVMTRIADQITGHHANVAEVRFATTPEDARRVEDLAGRLAAGNLTEAEEAEVAALIARGTPAGTVNFPPTYPPQGSRGE